MTMQPAEHHVSSTDFAVITGPIVGTFTLADGTVYDATPKAVDVRNQDEADELSYLIGMHHERHGHPLHDRDVPYKIDRKHERMAKFAHKSYKVHPDNTHIVDAPAPGDNKEA